MGTTSSNMKNPQAKTYCPRDCGCLMQRGRCKNITNPASAQAKWAHTTIINIMLNALNTLQKGTADSHYLRPSVVFENICVCNGNSGGVDRSECDIGWTTADCAMQKTPIVGKSFARLSEEETQTFVSASQKLKKWMSGVWSWKNLLRTWQELLHYKTFRPTIFSCICMTLLPETPVFTMTEWTWGADWLCPFRTSISSVAQALYTILQKGYWIMFVSESNYSQNLYSVLPFKNLNGK